MSLRRWLPSTLLALYVVAFAVAIWLESLAGESDVVEAAPFLIALSVFIAVGWLIASHHPENALGWLFMGLALSIAFAGAADSYANYALRSIPPPLPGGRYGAWLSAWLWPLATTLMMLIALLFPNGRPAGPRWKVVLWAAGAIGFLMVIGVAFAPGLLDSPLRVRNPFGISMLEGIVSNGAPVAGNVVGLIIAVFVPSALIGGAASLITRSRRARGDERQQLKWVGYAFIFLFAMVLLANLLGEGAPTWVKDSLFAVGVAAVPIATAFAIFRYRLYDIDVVINRTLVYLILTGALGALYFAIVAGASTFAGDSKLVVAAATLAVAGAFRPLRRRVQDFIDQRFYRRKYDAAQTIDDFARRLRDEIDLESLTGELVGVVHQTMQPRHVTVWVRGPS